MPKMFYNYKVRKSILESILKQIDSLSIDEVVFESIYMLSLVSFFKRKSVKIKFNFHNVESKLLFDIGSLQKNLLTRAAFYYDSYRTLLLETRILKSKKITCGFLSKCDMDYYSKKIKIQSSLELLDNKLYLTSKVIRNKIDNYILFPGSLSFEPNYHGIRWFLENIYMDIYSQHNISLVVTGKYSSEQGEYLSKFPGIDMAGFVTEEKLMNLYSHCLCVISPILKGSGIKIKNIEAMQLGVPIVMTEFSSRGILGYSHLDNSVEMFKQGIISEIIY